MSRTTTQYQQYFPSLDGIRAVAIISVIAAHASFRLHDGDTRNALLYIFGTGKLGVQIFFVISGFLITTLLLREKAERNDISLRNFYARRFLRIIPAALVYLLVLSIIDLTYKTEVSYIQFIGAIFFLMNYSYFHTEWLSGHFWSLSVEEQFYLVFPFILKKSIKVYTAFLLLFLGVILFSRYIIQYSIGRGYSNFFTRNPESIDYFDGIIIGSLFSIALFRDLINVEWILRKKKWLHIICIPLIIIIFNEHMPTVYQVYLGNFNSMICAVLIGILMISNLQEKKDIVFRVLNSKIAKKIGVLSYSLYLYNMLFTPNQGFPASTRLPTFSFPVIVNMLLLLLFAAASHYFIEKPIIKLKRYFRQ